MSKIKFNEERCFGCGACINIAPDNFTYSDDGRTVMINDVANEDAIEASEICPASAIVIENTESCECSGGCTCGDNCECDENNKCSDDCTCGDECHCGEDCNCGDDCDCKNK